MLSNKLRSIDIFGLGFCTLLYLLIIFVIPPILISAGVTTVFISHQNNILPTISGKSIIAIILTFISFTFGYFYLATKLNITYKLQEKLNFHVKWHENRILPVFIALIVTGFGYKILNVMIATGNISASELSGINFFSLNKFHIVALSLIVCYGLVKKAVNNESNIYYLAVLYFLTYITLIFAFTNSRLALATPILVMVITSHYLYRRIRIKYVVYISLLILVMLPVKMVMKNSESSRDAELGKNDSAFALNIKETAIDGTLGRIAQSHILTSVVEKTHIYNYGVGYVDYFRSLNPLYKLNGIQPNFYNDGNDFGKAYGVLGKLNDDKTGIGPTYPGDMYLNFGYLGILFGMILVGVLHRILYDSTIKKLSIAGVFIYSTLFMEIIHSMEDWVSLSYAKHTVTIMLILSIHYILTVDYKKIKY